MDSRKNKSKQEASRIPAQYMYSYITYMAISRISRLQIHAVDCKSMKFNALLTQQKKVIS
jgi:hypothetical protein